MFTLVVYPPRALPLVVIERHLLTPSESHHPGVRLTQNVITWWRQGLKVTEV